MISGFWYSRIAIRELIGSQFLGGEAVKEGDGSQHVAIGLDYHFALLKRFGQKLPQRPDREAPAPLRPPLIVADLTDAGGCRQKPAAWLEDPVNSREGGPDVINQMECLRQDDAVEGVGRKMVGARQIPDERCSRDGLHVQDIAPSDARATEAASVGIVPNLDHAPMNVVGPGGQEPFDVVPVDREAAIIAKLAAHRLQPSEIAEADMAYPGRVARTRQGEQP